jgi:ABC-2 type transport system permease protein
MYRAWLFVKRGLINMFSYKTALALGILGSFVGILQFTFMGRFLSEGNTFSAIQQYGGNIIAYLIIGSAFTAFLGVSLNSFQGAIRSEQQMGTLEHLLMGPTKLELLLMYSGAWSFLNTLLNVSVLLAVVVFVFGISLEMNLVGAVIVLILTVLGLSGIGLMSAGVIMVTKVGDPITWIFTTLTGLLSGVLFPIQYLACGLISAAHHLCFGCLADDFDSKRPLGAGITSTWGAGPDGYDHGAFGILCVPCWIRQGQENRHFGGILTRNRKPYGFRNKREHSQLFRGS